MRQPRPPEPTTDLASLGRELARLRHRCRRLYRDKANWSGWSAAVEETNALARRIGRVQPRSIADLIVRYDALHWLMVEQDDVIMDVEAKREFVAFGRAVKRTASQSERG